MLGEHVFGEKHHEAVGEDHFARVGHDAETVAVAVRGKAVIGPGRAHRFDEVREVGGLRRIGMVVRKGPVDVGKSGTKSTLSPSAP